MMCDRQGGNEKASPEITVTPEMIEAGFKIFSKSGIADDYLEADKLLIAEIYRAMFALRDVARSAKAPKTPLLTAAPSPAID